MYQLFKKDDEFEILRLQKIEEPSGRDMESVFVLYKRYINPELTSYNIGCGCSNSITKIYQELMYWYSINLEKFNK